MTQLLIDSSIWIDHIRQPNEQLAILLRRRRVLTHPLVIGEVAMGSIKPRGELLAGLGSLPQAIAAQHTEVLDLVERHRLFGTGIGFTDAHLIASALLTPGAKLWTKDRRLQDAARALGIAGGGS